MICIQYAVTGNMCMKYFVILGKKFITAVTLSTVL